jgi:hypothetical protein
MDGYQRFLADPKGEWERMVKREGYLKGFFEAFDTAKPNPGHYALAELEKIGVLKSLITQNVDNFQVYIVDGEYIRKNQNEEFTNFGQHYRYPYIPLKEFWIDQEAEHNEVSFFIDHLLVEYTWMAKGMPYEQAIVEADKAERKERRRGNGRPRRRR